MAVATAKNDRAVLVLAPTGKDAQLACHVLGEYEVGSEICHSLTEVAQRFGPSTEALLVAEEALAPNELMVLSDAVSRQPPWSDVPIIVLTTGGKAVSRAMDVTSIFGPNANVTLLERPLRAMTLVAAIRTAIRARTRQYEVRELLEQRDMMLTAISDAFSALDRDFRYVYVNDKVVELAGRPADEIIGRIIWDVFPEAVGSEFYDRCHVAMDKRQPQHFEIFYKPWKRWLDTRIYPTRDGIAILRADVTELHEQRERARKTEAELGVVEQRARLAVEAADLGTFEYYPQDDRLEWSERCRELFGLPPDAPSTREIYLRAIHPDDRAVIADTVRRVAEPSSDGRYEIEYRAVGVDGTQLRWLSEKGRVLLDEDKRAVRFIGAILDITERKNADAAVRASEAQLRFVTDHAAPILLAHCSADERYIFVNAPFASFFNTPRERVIGRTIPETIGERAYAVVKPYILRVLGGERVVYDVEVPYKHGAHWMSYTLVPEIRGDGSVNSFVAVIQDVTERKKAELALQEAKQTAEQANRAKDQFLAMLSHELRTPLTPVLMAITSLQQSPDLPEDTRRDVDVIRRNIELESLLIDDLLDLTRIAHGKLELHHDAVDVHAAIEHALMISTGDVQEKRLRIEKQLDAVERFSWADAARLQQVFWNLLKNAVKFTPAGGRILVRTHNDGEHRVIVDIIDEGIGIAPELQARIFDAFEQGGQTMTRRYGGLGLGLAISKRVVDLHGGEIEVFSEGSGRGARFTVTLKAMETSMLGVAAPAAAEVISPTGRGEILLVEDHADTARVLRRMLEVNGYRVLHADNIARARELAGQRAFDLLISDVGLPDGSGLDFMRELQARRSTPAIALSGFGMDNDVEASRLAGFAEHLTKPVDWERLRDIIERLLALRPDQSSSR